MTFGWVMIGVLVAVCYTQRAAGMVLLRRGPQSKSLQLALTLVPVAILAAVVATQTFTTGPKLVLDARLPALTAATVAAWRRLPLPVICLIAAVVAAAVRYAGWLP